MNRISKPNDLIAINSPVHNPTAMYFAHRRGWTAPNEYLLDSIYLHEIKNKGCKYVVIAKKLYGDLNLRLLVAHDSEYYKIYKIK